MQDLDNKATGGSLSAAEWNEVPSELQNVIIDTGQSLTSSDLNQLGKAIADYSQAGQWYADTGATNSIVLTRTGSLKNPIAYRDGQQVRFIAGATITGATVINVATIGSKEVRDQNDAQLLAGDLVAGLPYSLFYDQSKNGGVGAFVLQKASTAPNVLPRNYIDGFITNVNSVDTLALDISAGASKASSNDLDGSLSVATSKKLDAAWVDGGTVGAPVGGFPSALTLTANTWYRVFLIFKPTGQVGAGFDTSSGAANLLADAAGDGFTKSRQVGWVFYSGGVIKSFRQIRNKFIFDEPIRDFNGAPTTSASTITLTAPPDNSVIANTLIFAEDDDISDDNCFGLITSLDIPDAAPTAAIHNVAWHDGGTSQGGQSTRVEVPVNASGQIRSRWSNNDFDTLMISTLGFEFNRGQQ